jgi:hypothetical protein
LPEGTAFPGTVVTKILLAVTATLLPAVAGAQSTTPSVYQVLMYSATQNQHVTDLSGSSFTLSNSLPSIYTETRNAAELTNSTAGQIFLAPNYTVSKNFLQLSNALNASIATALSIIPLSSPASGVITRIDPATGAELPVSSTLGPIFTERAETIGKGKFYIGFSNQDFHFTKFNGTSLNALSILYRGGDSSNVFLGGTQLSTVPATFAVGMDVRLSQDIAFITYGVTNRLDVSLGLPTIHSAVSARTYAGTIYAGNGEGTNGSTCWCVDTFTPGFYTLMQPNIGQSAMSKTGFGDLLLRVKGTVVQKPNFVMAVGGDIRFPTGDAQNYLGVGTTTVKPFVAVSFYSKPLAHNIVFSPHFDAGWEFGGKSILGGQLQPMAQSTSGVDYFAAPFTSTKGYLPDVFTWAVGAELAISRRSTLIADILGNQIGWIHGIPNATTQTIANQLLPTGINGDPMGLAVPTKGPATGLVSAGSVSFGQYSGSFGYKVRVMGDLVANFNVLVRFDNNGLTARFVPLVGLGYSF